MIYVFGFIALCAFSAQLWAFRCYQELRDINDELARARREERTRSN